jgi:hypothetical protein
MEATKWLTPLVAGHESVTARVCKVVARAVAEGRTLPWVTRALIGRVLDADVPAEVRG